jgi:hydroxypyruvate isomerase
MPRFAANLTMLFTEHPFLDRFERAAKAGFEAVEFLFPYDFKTADIQARLRDNDLKLVLHNLPAGNWAEGERGIAVLPDRVDEFREGVGRAIETATALGVKQLNCLAGKAPLGASESLLRNTFVSNLRFAAGELKKAGLKLLIEPVNNVDIPGFFLTRSAQALAIIEDVGSDNLFLQFDLYHAQRMEGELTGTLKRHLDRIAHVQIADNPGRHEPGTGEVNWDFIFKQLDELGYPGHVGCEYAPAAGTEAGLGWFKPYRRR